jgi:phage shock protein A
MVVIRFLFALLVGFLAGAGTMLWLVQSGAGDFMIRRTEVVQDMERKVRDLEQQRDSLTRTLEDVASRTERMEKVFNDLEAKYRALAAEQAAAPRQAPRDAGSQPGSEP